MGSLDREADIRRQATDHMEERQAMGQAADFHHIEVEDNLVAAVMAVAAERNLHSQRLVLQDMLQHLVLAHQERRWLPLQIHMLDRRSVFSFSQHLTLVQGHLGLGRHSLRTRAVGSHPSGHIDRELVEQESPVEELPCLASCFTNKVAELLKPFALLFSWLQKGTTTSSGFRMPDRLAV